MKVLLISANTVRVPYYIYPLGLDYVAGAISDRHTVRMADVNMNGKIKSLIDGIIDFAPDVIGVSLRNIDNVDVRNTKSYMEKYQELIKTIRKHTKAVIVLGGSGFTIFPKKILNLLNADYGVIGEGERMSGLLDALESGKDPSSIQGIIARGNEEAFPPPLHSPFERSGVTSEIAQFYIDNGGMLNLQTKRGCTFNCIYCTYPHIEGRELRPIPADEVANDALNLERAGAKFLFITDSAFNADFGHSMEVARAFARKGLSIPWGAFMAPTKPPDNYYRILHDSGMTHVEFGTEALSPSMLASYQKPFNVKDVFSAHTLALEAGMHTAHYILLGGPGENRYTVDETLANAQMLAKTVVFFFSGIRIYPHTKISDIALEEGQISASDDLLAPVFYQSRYITSEEISLIVEERREGRENWFFGSGGNNIARLMSRMHKQGHAGPLWEMMIR
jgi:radical SAM superfamily enzyme YgiQ (UPF0313 family)